MPELDPNCSYDCLEGRHMESVYNYQTDEGILVNGNMKTTWDDKHICISIDLPFEMSDERFLDIFQGLLTEAVRIKDYEKRKKENSDGLESVQAN